MRQGTMRVSDEWESSIMSTATVPIASIGKTPLREVNVLQETAGGRQRAEPSPDACHLSPAFLKKDAEDCEGWNEEDWQEWLALNPPIPIEDDPTITPEHLERLRQRSRDVDEGRTKVIPFTDDEWEEFCREMEHSPEEAIAKAESRRCYLHELTPKQS